MEHNNLWDIMSDMRTPAKVLFKWKFDPEYNDGKPFEKEGHFYLSQVNVWEWELVNPGNGEEPYMLFYIVRKEYKKPEE